jgi:uroporphyrinogen decarboxylase
MGHYKKVVEEIKAYKNIPVVAHSDGQLMGVLDKYVKCGFDGLQSLQPSAGMNISEIKDKYGNKLCLWGNIDLDYVMSFDKPIEVKKVVRETIDIASVNSGFILSTCNSMLDSIPPENVLAMMEESEKQQIDLAV